MKALLCLLLAKMPPGTDKINNYLSNRQLACYTGRAREGLKGLLVYRSSTMEKALSSALPRQNHKKQK